MRAAAMASAGEGPLTKKIILEEARTFDLEIITKLSCVGRRINGLTCLDLCINLTELNLSNNAIACLDGLESLQRLKKLVLTSNRIASLDGVQSLTALQHLLVQDNMIASIEDVQALADLPGLQSVYFQNLGGDLRNPVCRIDHYKVKVLDLLPNLRNLDGERKPGKNLYNVDVEVPKREPLPASAFGNGAGRSLAHDFDPADDMNIAEIIKPAKALLAELHTLNISAKEEIQHFKDEIF